MYDHGKLTVQALLGDATRLQDAPLCRYSGHVNHFLTDLVRLSANDLTNLGCSL